MTERAGQPPTSGDNEPGSKNFAARDAEQNNWREMLRGLVGPKRGLLGSVVFGTAGPKQSKVATVSKSRLVWIGGMPGVGKTRLAARLRDIAQHDKEFTHRFRTTRLDWAEVRERDTRLTGLSLHQSLPSELFLDVLRSHLEREDLGGYLNDFQQAMTETAELSRTVTGPELAAVWEFRARGLGRSLKGLSGERPLLFLIDNTELWEVAAHQLWQPIFEESGSLVVWVWTGTAQPQGWKEVFAPERTLEMQLTAFSPDEMRRFLEIEAGRYKERVNPTAEPTEPVYKSPDKVIQLTELSDGVALAARLLVYMLESGMTLDELGALPLGSDKITLLLNKVLEEIFNPGHPDYLKIYALGVLRRPERGLLGALLDLRQDMLPLDDLLRRVNARYEFMFEPSRQLKLHTAIERPLRLWLLAHASQDENGLVRINRRASSYLDERLREWGLTFQGLKSKIGDVKWAEWALDKVWHSFWQSPASGWAEAVPIFVAGLGYKPLVASQLVVMLEELQSLGVLGQPDDPHLADFQAIIEPASTNRSIALQNLQDWSNRQHWFGQHLASIDEFERILSNQLNQNKADSTL